MAIQITSSTDSKGTIIVNGQQALEISADGDVTIPGKYYRIINGVPVEIGNGGTAPAPTTAINTPSITFPANDATAITYDTIVASSDFSVSGDLQITHVASFWQISESETFNSFVYQSNRLTTNKTSLSLSTAQNLLTSNKFYYVRVRYEGSNGSLS